MSPLSARQAVLARAIRAGDARAAAPLLAGPGLAPAARLQIHRNHHRVSLTAALAATYPVVARLVGAPCFAGLAREFILLSPPASPCLFEYGAGFARYLAAVPLLMELPYLPDVARLEWAMNAARHAADAPRLPDEALAPLHDSCFAEVVVTLHPSVRLLASPYPLERIWRANQPEADPEATIALDHGAVRLLVYRDRDDDVAWAPLSVGAFSFLAALREGRTLGRAWTRAGADEAAFDGSRFLAGLIAAGVFSDFRFPCPAMKR